MSVVFNFSPMAIFPIPFSTFVSSDETYSGFFIPFFKTECIFLMRPEQFFPVSQLIGLLIHTLRSCWHQLYLLYPVWFKPFLFFYYFSQLDINSSLTNNFSCQGFFGFLHLLSELLVFLPHFLPVLIFCIKVIGYVSLLRLK